MMHSAVLNSRNLTRNLVVNASPIDVRREVARHLNKWSTVSWISPVGEHAGHPGGWSGSLRDSLLLTGSHPHLNLITRRVEAALSFDATAFVEAVSTVRD